ncbi:hypothetical protein [Clostridium formicaceticum]|uniref:Uncharacterized protein n=1 Tax=Clostridium formicaceticum TaxID=1497 RepID=A0AAC9WGF8_9CLOT|nr:hypothetical protein [Clostridium formicaceticum]AOY77247.1 hypothetical protein BJL90_16155 [Clostridium formicaceticum]ARE87781.1 hypothetical protein CLFO_21810 [Clostridium formicaceticum]
MIQIDDAGSGSLLGGTIIGVLRTETGEFQYSVIPLDYYRGKNFDRKSYINYVVTIVEKIFQKLQVTKEEDIEICRGYMFDLLDVWLNEKGYRFTRTKIQEPLQSKIETAFEEYAIELGLPQKFISYTKYPFHFHRILKWVYADYDNRSLLCKTGWKSWKKFGNLSTEYSQESIKSKNLICLKCYEIIPKNTTATVISYYSNKLNKVFIHNACI